MKQTGGFVSSMNNEQKNSYVKEQITKTLLRLLETKNIDDISISELTNAAEIGRVSFYRNYKSKEDILRQEAGSLLTQWGSIFQTMSSNDEYNSFFLSLFERKREKTLIKLNIHVLCFVFLINHLNSNHYY